MLFRSSLPNVEDLQITVHDSNLPDLLAPQPKMFTESSSSHHTSSCILPRLKRLVLEGVWFNKTDPENDQCFIVMLCSALRARADAGYAIDKVVVSRCKSWTQKDTDLMQAVVTVELDEETKQQSQKSE